MRVLRGGILILLAISLTGCMSGYVYDGNGTRGSKPYTVAGRTYFPLKTSAGYSETGTASWYGPKFHGKQTASGEIYNQNKMTAAHKTLPLGSTVRVKNLENGRSVVVRINDRGPFVSGRIIDLSRAAAEQLDMMAAGTARVRVESVGIKTVGAPSSATAGTTAATSSGSVYIQVGSFSTPENAENMSAQVKAAGYNNRVKKLDSGLTAVQIGPYASRDAASAKLDKIRSVYSGAFLVQ